MQIFTKRLNMEDLEIWKIVNLEVKSTGLLISSHGNIKNGSFIDRKNNDNGAGYKFAPITVSWANRHINRVPKEILSAKFKMEEAAKQDGKLLTYQLDADED